MKADRLTLSRAAARAALLVKPPQFSSFYSLEHLEQRIVDSDVEIRRGMVALNAGGLVAIVGLLSAKLPPAAVREGAEWFFAGLMFALAQWVIGELVLGLALATTRARQTIEKALADGGEGDLSGREITFAVVYLLTGEPGIRVLSPITFSLIIAALVAFIGGSVTILTGLPK